MSEIRITRRGFAPRSRPLPEGVKRAAEAAVKDACERARETGATALLADLRPASYIGEDMYVAGAHTLQINWRGDFMLASCYPDGTWR